MTDDPEETESADDAPVADQYTSFARYMEAEREREERRYSEVATTEGYAALLGDAAASYTAVEDFTIGQLIQWKPMMRNRPFPLEAVPAIVMRFIEAPRTVDGDGDAVMEPDDLVVGVVDGGRIFRLMPVTAARFVAWEP